MAEWSKVGGLASGGFVYEHHSGARAYLHVNGDGEVEVETWDPADGLAFPNFDALITIAGEDLRRMQESGRPEHLAELLVSGVGLFAPLRGHRGRKRRWTPQTLLAFARGFVRLGERWSPEHARWARDEWGLGRRQALDVMHKAERVGIVTITKSSGFANVYGLSDATEPSTRGPRERADWHRRGWLHLRAKGAELDQAAHSAVGMVPPPPRTLDDFRDQLAGDGGAVCANTRRGLRCVLRAGHAGSCFAWYPWREAS
jgi:hypothetical protein